MDHDAWYGLWSTISIPRAEATLCACATKASFNAHLACRHFPGFCLIFLSPFAGNFFFILYFISLFFLFFNFIFAIILLVAATEVALDALPPGQRLSVICPRRSVVILWFPVSQFSRLQASRLARPRSFHSLPVLGPVFM